MILAAERLKCVMPLPPRIRNAVQEHDRRSRGVARLHEVPRDSFAVARCSDESVRHDRVAELLAFAVHIGHRRDLVREMGEQGVDALKEVVCCTTATQLVAHPLRRIGVRVGNGVCHTNSPYLTTLRCVPRSIAPSSVDTPASTTSPSCRYFGLLACRLKNAFHFTAGGSSEPMISSGFGGALSAVPIGVAVRMRSPAARSWKRVNDCSAASGLYSMSPSTSMFCRSS